MKLFYWSEAPNFGDRINVWLWPRLIPRLLNGDDDCYLLGSGTLLNPATARRLAGYRKKVLGAGVGYLEGGEFGAQVVAGTDWKFYCVRGALTAEALGLPQELAVTDAAHLVAKLVEPRDRKQGAIFMPHWQNRCGLWKPVCAALGIRYVDPFSPVESIIDTIASADLVLAEAMHGAVVANALRTPWVGLCSTQPDRLDFKWEDWCGSVGLEYRPVPIPYLGARSKSSGRARELRGIVDMPSAVGSLRHALKRGVRQLSPESVNQRLLERLESCLWKLERDVLN
jgi:succinoglycan biosynthesis protein ExoV